MAIWNGRTWASDRWIARFGLSPHLGTVNDEKKIAFYTGVIHRLRAIPGVLSVTLMGNRIGSGWSNNTNTILDGKRAGGGDIMRWNSVGADFFTTLGVSLREGRDFRDSDSLAAPKVAIVNETFVKRFLKGRDAIGHIVSYTPEVAFTIVGVVADSKYRGVREDPIPMAYFPYPQVGLIGDMHIELRTPGSPASFLPEVRKAIASLAPDLALLQPMSQSAQFAASITQDVLVSRLAQFFSALAILLVASGLYGTLAYSVSRRTSEFGVRMAIGCERAELLWMVLREGLLLSLVELWLGCRWRLRSQNILTRSCLV